MITAFHPLAALLVFLCYLALDSLYVRYTVDVLDGHAARAAIISTVLNLLLALGIGSTISCIWYLIPMSLGSWIGTFFVTKAHQRKQNLTKMSAKSKPNLTTKVQS